MAILHYSVTINASKNKVWHTMLDQDTYRQWTGPFFPGSYYEGSWSAGSEIRFIAKTDGKINGLLGRVAENTPYEFVSVIYAGQIIDGEIDIQSEDSHAWIGAHENYRFTEHQGVTTVEVELGGENVGNEFEEMFGDSWPKSLEKLKQIVEQ